MKKLILILLLPYSYANAQNLGPELPTVDKPCPNFTLKKVQYYKKKTVSLADFKGKWLIIDCWNRYCSICLHKMPHIDSLQREFSNEVKFILVGYTGTQYSKRSDDKLIRKLYENNRKEMNLNLTVAFDSVLFHRFKIGPCPYLIIVDPEGIVRGLTNDITSNQLKDLMVGKPVEFNKVYTRKNSHLDD